MADFAMKIAGITGAVTPLFDSTVHYCKGYLTQEPADFAIRVTREALLFEQAELDREAEEEGFRRRIFTDPFLERAAIQRGFAEALFDRHVAMLHGSAVAVDGRGYLFAARSGTGKSTHTRFWREEFGPRAVMVNDDKPFVAVTEAGVFLCGSPWSGKHGLDANVTVPLAGICLLERGKEDRIAPLDSEDLLEMLLRQGYCPLDGQKREAYRALVERITASVPLWRMACTPQPNAARVAYAAMSAAEST